MQIKVTRSVKFGDNLIQEDKFFGGEIIATMQETSDGYRAGLNPRFATKHDLEVQEFRGTYEDVVAAVSELVSSL